VKLSELITGYGVSESIFHFYKSSKKVLKGKKVLIQGAGNVGASVSYYLHKHGAKIVMISDKNGFFHEPKGLNTESLTQLLKSRRVDNDFNDVYPNDELLTHLENQRIDIFIPAASSNVVSKSFIDLLISRGLDIISCGANNPFIEDDLCYGQLSQYIDGRLALLPDFVANSGMARAFYKAMSSDTLLTSNDVFQDVSSMMKIVVDKCTEFEEHTSFSANAFLLALNGGFSYVNNVNLVA
jgi:glutamate dehydrogenase (NAD(P)+)